MECPDCGSQGFSRVLAHGIKKDGRRGCWWMDHKCSFCKGSGQATDEMMKRRAFGHQLRDKRRAEDLSLRELCKKLSFDDFPLWSRIEHGSHDGPIPEIVTNY